MSFDKLIGSMVEEAVNVANSREAESPELVIIKDGKVDESALLENSFYAFFQEIENGTVYRRYKLWHLNIEFFQKFIASDIEGLKATKYDIQKHSVNAYTEFPTMTISILDPFQNLPTKQFIDKIKSVVSDFFQGKFITVVAMNFPTLTTEIVEFPDGLTTAIPKWEIPILYQEE